MALVHPTNLPSRTARPALLQAVAGYAIFALSFGFAVAVIFGFVS